MKKVEILICSEEGFWVHGGREGGGGGYVNMISTLVRKREKKRVGKFTDSITHGIKWATPFN